MVGPLDHQRYEYQRKYTYEGVYGCSRPAYEDEIVELYYGGCYYRFQFSLLCDKKHNLFQNVALRMPNGNILLLRDMQLEWTNKHCHPYRHPRLMMKESALVIVESTGTRSLHEPL